MEELELRSYSTHACTAVFPVLCGCVYGISLVYTLAKTRSRSIPHPCSSAHGHLCALRGDTAPLRSCILRCAFLPPLMLISTFISNRSCSHHACSPFHRCTRFCRRFLPGELLLQRISSRREPSRSPRTSQRALARQEIAAPAQHTQRHQPSPRSSALPQSPAATSHANSCGGGRPSRGALPLEALRPLLHDT